MKNSKFFLTTLFAAAAMSAVPAHAAGEVISINFGKTEDNITANMTGNAGLVTYTDGSGATVTGVGAAGWSNATGQNGTNSELKNYNGDTIAGASVTWVGAQAPYAGGPDKTGSVLSAIQHSYMDLSGNNKWNISVDTRFLVCDVYLYFSGDGSKYSPVNVNGTSYIGGTNVLAGSETEWGDRRSETSGTLALGTNAILVTGTAGALSLSNVPQNNTGKRATISGMQIVNTYAGTAHAATLDVDSAWTTTQLGSAPWTNSTAAAGTYADVTLSEDVNLSASAGIVTDGIVVSGGHTLTLSAAGGNTAGIDLIGPGGVRVTNGSTLSLANGTILNFKGSKSSITGAISGAGSLVAKSGSSLNLAGATLTGFTGTLSAESGATLSIGAGSANGATATLAENSVYSVTASASGAVALDNVSGAGTLKFAAVGDTTNSGGGNGAFSTISLGTGFTGTVEITSGVVDMLTGDATSAISSERLGNASKVVLNGGGLLFRNVNNTTQNDKGTFDKAIEVGANGGVIRVYGTGNVTVASDISGAGTLRHTDGGTLTLTGTIDMTGGFSQVKGTTNFTGTTTLGTLTVSGGTLNILSDASIGSSGANNKSISVSANGNLNIGDATRNVSVSAAGLFMSDGDNADTTNTLTVASGSELNITGSSNMSADGGTAGYQKVSILVGHWNSTANLNLAGTLNSSSAVVYVGYTNNQVSNVNVQSGGVLNALGVNGQNWNGTANFTLSEGGAAHFGTSGIKNMDSVSLGAGTIGSLSASGWTTSQNMTLSGADGAATIFNTSVYDAATKTYGDASSITLNGVLSGTGGLTKRGAGTLTLGGANTYTGATMVEAGTLVAGNASALGAGNVTVESGATLKRGIDGSVSVGGTFTTADGAILDLGALSADTAAISATGAVTISAGTIFDMTEASAGLKLVAGSSVAADGLSIANIYVGGKLANQRGTATFEVTNNTLVLSAYTAGANWNITWNGGDDGVWKVNGSGWTKDESQASFQHGDSVTFATAGAQVTVEGVVNPVAIGDSPAITIAANTTFKGTDATVNVANGSLAFSNNAKLEIQNGVTLDFGTAATALDLSNVTGDGMVKYVFNTEGGASGLVTSDGFTGTVDYVGNLNWSDNGKEGQVTIGNAAMTLRLTSRDGQPDGMWGRFGKTFANNVEFGSDYKIWLTSGSVAFAGRVDAAGKTLTTAGGSNLTFSGAANVGTLNISGGKVAVTGTGALSATISNLAAGATLELAGTGNRSEITLSGSTSISGNLTIGNATVDASGSGDIFNYGVGQTQTITLNAGGELALGAQRQSFCSNVDFVLNGGKISGTGENNNGYALDFFQSNTISVTDDSEISANLCMRGGNDKTLAIDVDADKTLTFSGKIVTPASGAGSNAVLVKRGSGTLVLSGANTYNQGTRIEAGTLVAASANALGTGAVTVASGATLEHGVAGGATLNTGALTLASGSVLDFGAIAYSENGAISATGDVSIDAGTTISVDNLLYGASLVKASGTMNAEAANATVLFLGLETGDRTALTVADGALILVAQAMDLTWDGGEEGVWRANGSGWDNLGSARDFQNGDTATFSGDVAANVTLDGAVALGIPAAYGNVESSGISMTVGSGADDAADYAFTGTNGAEIRANGKFVKQGTGTAKFTDVDFSEFAGNFEVSAGTLELAYSEGEEGVVASKLTGGATLKVSGAGKLTLSGADTAHGNELSGGVVIDGGTLSVNSTGWGSKGNLGTLFSYAGTELKNGGVLEVTEAQLHEDDGYSWRQGGARRGFSVSEGTGTYRYAGTEDSVVTQNGANQQIGVADGAIVNFDVVNAGTKLTVTKAIAKNTDSGTEDSTGKVAKSGAGTLVLDPNSVHYAGVILNAGVLEIASADALGTGKILEVGSGADMTLRGSGASALTLGSDVTISYRTDSGVLEIDNVVFDGTTLYLADVANNAALFSGYTGGDGVVNDLFTITGVAGSGLNLISRDGTIYFFNQKNLTWAGADGAVWSTDSSLLNWTSLDAPGSGTFAFANDDRVTFAVDGASVTVEGDVLPNTVTVSAATTFAGTGTVALASSDKLTLGATLTLGEGVTLKFTNAIGSNEALSDYSKIAGTGTFAFSSSVATTSTNNGIGIDLSNFSGDVYLTGGRLLLGNATITSSFGSASLRVASGAELTFNGSGTDIANAVTFEGDSAIHANSGKSGTLSGIVTAATGTLMKKGAGTLTLSGASNINVLNVNAGSVTFAKSAATGAPANAGTHVVGRLAGGGTVSVDGGASLTINGAEASTIGTLTLADGSLNITAGSMTISGGTLAGGELLVSGAGSLTATFSSVGANSSLTLAGTGAASAVTISTDPRASIADSATLNITNGSVTWVHDCNDSNLSGNKTTGASIFIGEGSSFTEKTNYKYHATFTGALSGAGTLISLTPTDGPGQNDGWRKITLSGSTANFTGEWQLESANGSGDTNNRHILGILNSSDDVFGGVINFTSTNADAAKVSSKLVLLKDMEIGGLKGSELENTSVVGASAVSDNTAGSITTADRALTINVADGKSYDYAGKIDSTISLTKTGSGTQILSGDNSAYMGAIVVEAGTLAATRAAALGSATGAAISMDTDGTLELRGVAGEGNAAVVFAKSLTGTGTFALTGASRVEVEADKLSRFTGTLNVADEASTLQVSAAAGPETTVGANLDGAGTFEKLGDGTLALSAAAAADRTGSTTVSAGTLALTNASALGSGEVSLAAENATLELRGLASFGNTVNSDAGAGKLALTGGSNLTMNFGDQLSNFGGKVDLGAGTRLNLGIDVDDVAAFGQFRNAASIGDGATLGIDAGAADAAFAMTLSGTGTLEKLGDGTLTLAAASVNAFTGTLKVAAGTLSLDGTTPWTLANAVAGRGALEISGKITAHASKFTSEFRGETKVLENSELEIGTTADASLSTAITGTGTLTKTGAGTLSLAAGTTVKNINLNAGGLAGVTLVDGQTLKVGAADVTLSGANELTAGTLYIRDVAVSEDAGALKIAGGTTTVGVDLKIDVNVEFPELTNPSFETGSKVAHVNTYTLIKVDGGSLEGWDTLTKENFLVNGAAIDSHRESVLTNVENVAPGQISLELKSCDLLWNGRNGDVWNVNEEDNLVWTRADDGEAESYMNSDRVTFGSTATVKLGEPVAPQKITVTGGATLTLDCVNHAVEYGTTTIESGSTLALAIGDAAHVYFAEPVKVLGAGTLRLDVSNTASNANLSTLIEGTIDGSDGLTFEKAGAGELWIADYKLSGFKADNTISVSEGSVGITRLASIGGANLVISEGASAVLEIVDDETLRNRVTGRGVFTTTGGTLTLSANNSSFEGTFRVVGGTAVLKNANGMGDAALGTDVYVLKDQLAGADEGAGVLELAFSDVVYNKNFYGDGKIVANNASKLTLRGGEGDFSGDFVVNRGLVSAQKGGSFGAGRIVFADANKAVEFKLTEAGEFAGKFVGAGTVTVAAGSETLTLSGASSDDFAGTLKVEASAVAEHAEVLGSENATVEIGANGELTAKEGMLNAKLSGSGLLTKTGADLTLTLANAANDFSGRIAVKEGTLSVSDARALGSTRGVELRENATLEIVVSAGETFTLDRAVSGDGGVSVANDGDGTRTHDFVWGLGYKSFRGDMMVSGVSMTTPNFFSADDASTLTLRDKATWHANGGFAIGEKNTLVLRNATTTRAFSSARTLSASSTGNYASTLISGAFRASSGDSGSVELSGISVTPTPTASGEAGAVLSFGVDSRPDARVAPIVLSGDGSVTLNNVSVEVFLGGDLGSAFDVSEIRLVDAADPLSSVEGETDSVTIVLADGSEVEYHYRNGWLTLEAVPTGMNLAYAAMVTLPTETFSQDVRSLHRRMEQRRFGVEDRNEWQFFAQAQTMSADTGSDKSDSATFDYSTYGALVGADVRVGESTLFGLALAYDRGTANIHDNQGEITSDAYRATLYAGTVFADYLYAEAGAHVGFASNEIDRKGDYDRNKGDADAWSAGAFATVGGVIPTGVDGFFLTPHVGVAYLTTHVESFEERGTSAMKVDSISADSLRASAGLGAQVLFDFGEVPTRFTLDVSYSRECLDDDVDAKIRTEDGSLTRTEKAFAEDVISVGAGLDFSLSSNTGVFLNYTADFGLNSDVAHRANAGFRFTW